MIQVTAIQILLCFHGALEMGCELMLTSTDGYRATFYQKRQAFIKSLECSSHQ